MFGKLQKAEAEVQDLQKRVFATADSQSNSTTYY